MATAVHRTIEAQFSGLPTSRSIRPGPAVKARPICLDAQSSCCRAGWGTKKLLRNTIRIQAGGVRFLPGLAFLVVAPQLTLAHSDRKKVPLPAEKLVRFNHLPIRLLQHLPAVRSILFSLSSA